MVLRHLGLMLGGLMSCRSYVNATKNVSMGTYIQDFSQTFKCLLLFSRNLHVVVPSLMTFILLFVMGVRITNFSGQKLWHIVYWSFGAHKLHQVGICENQYIQIAQSIPLSFL